LRWAVAHNSYCVVTADWGSWAICRVANDSIIRACPNSIVDVKINKIEDGCPVANISSTVDDSLITELFRAVATSLHYIKTNQVRITIWQLEEQSSSEQALFIPLTIKSFSALIAEEFEEQDTNIVKGELA
jgi:hypothetical protein